MKTPETPPEFEIPDEGVPQGVIDLPDVSEVFEKITGEQKRPCAAEKIFEKIFPV